MSARARSFDRAFGEIEWEEHDPDRGCCPSQIFPRGEDDLQSVYLSPLPLDYTLYRREPLKDNPFGLWPCDRALDDLIVEGILDSIDPLTLASLISFC